MSQEHNGWTNYETRLVNLWLTNDEYTEEGLRMAVRYGGHKGAEQYVDELLYESGIASGTMWYDLITSCLSDVDWREIAGHYQDDTDDEEGDE